MIITRTPLRVSFLGGGSDYRNFFENQPGFVLGTTINKYVYVFAHPLPAVAPEKFRFTYRITESVLNHTDFTHPVMKETLKLFDWKEPMNFATMSDLPGSSGLGSSSSFTVGLVKALLEHQNIEKPRNEIAQLAVLIERDLIGEPGGLQDQFHAAFGGLNLYKFQKSIVEASTISLRDDVLQFISDSMVLVPFFRERNSGFFAQQTVKSINRSSSFSLVEKMAQLATQLSEALSQESDPSQALSVLAESLNQGWAYKSSITSVADKFSDVISELKRCGAMGVKLCGAGGSGFILALVNPEQRNLFMNKIKSLQPIKIGIEQKGSSVILKE